MFRRILISLVFVLLFPALLHAQSFLDTPSSGAFVSGLGYIAGWKCSGGNFTFNIDGGSQASLAYGISRGDTQSDCSDTNNGFITQFNWNLLGDGQHTIRVFDNGSQFAQAMFTVTTLGTAYLTGQSGVCSLIFDDQNVTLAWQENQQNFAVVGTGEASELASLLGAWAFTYTLTSTFTDHYLLFSLQTSSGSPYLGGVDISAGGVVIAARIQDLSPGSTIPFTFELLDPDLLYCDFYVFDKTGPNTVSGQYYLVNEDAAGNCTTPVTGTAYAMTGTRTLGLGVTNAEVAAIGQQKMQEVASPQAQEGLESAVAIDPVDLEQSIRTLQALKKEL